MKGQGDAVIFRSSIGDSITLLEITKDSIWIRTDRRLLESERDIILGAVYVPIMDVSIAIADS
jgi:hypothetical protein